MMWQSLPARKQHGAALVVAILMLLVMVLFALSAVRFSNFERIMGSNEESRVSAFQSAQSIADATTADPSNTPVFGGVGYSICTSGITGCNLSTLVLPDSYLSTLPASKANARVERRAPLFQNAPRSANLGSSLTNFSAAAFGVTGTYDRSADGLGQEQITEGLIIVFPKN